MSEAICATGNKVMNAYRTKAFGASILFLSCIAASMPIEETCQAKHMEMLQTGAVNYGEVLIDRSIDEVWPAIQQYYKWSDVHLKSQRKTIRGDKGEVGELVEIMKPGSSESVYAETVSIRPIETIDGGHRIANIVWKVYDKDVCFARYSDFGVREYQGKTIFFRSVYSELPLKSVIGIREEQAGGKLDSLVAGVTEAKAQIEAYIDTRK
jgi:hypothetical protein